MNAGKVKASMVKAAEANKINGLRPEEDQRCRGAKEKEPVDQGRLRRG
jgi:hypothetical protein